MNDLAGVIGHAGRAVPLHHGCTGLRCPASARASSQ